MTDDSLITNMDATARRLYARVAELEAENERLRAELAALRVSVNDDQPLPPWAGDGAWCRSERRRLGFSLVEPAEALGHSVVTVADMERGRLDPAPLVVYWKSRET